MISAGVMLRCVDGEGVADHGFLTFVHAKSEAADLAVLERDEARQDVSV